MTPLTRQEFTAALAGVRGLLRFDLRAFAHFNATHDGFWKSFWAAAILAPLVAIGAVRSAIDHPPESLGRYAALQVIAYALGWLAYPFAMVWIVDHLGRRERYYGYFAAYNWFQLAETAASTVLVLLGMTGILSDDAAMFLFLVLQGVFLGYDWFIAKHALGIESGTAAMLVAIDFLLSLIISWVSLALP